MMNIYQFTVKDYQGKPVSLKTYEQKVMLVVNTAIHCGLAPQYKGLEKLYQTYQKQGFEILDFPCNQFADQSPESDEETAMICETKLKNSFRPFAKIEVNGRNTHPLYQWLKKSTFNLFGSQIKWNFTKFLVNREGKVVKRYAPTVLPEAIAGDIQKLLK
jgi:glutathione peroxidase